jgi:hypothetical protein
MKETKDTPTLVGAVPGFLIGLIWLAMAATVVWTAVRGYANGRSDWALGWGLVGFFLSAAALSALIGTWWHQAKVKKPDH